MAYATQTGGEELADFWAAGVTEKDRPIARRGERTAGFSGGDTFGARVDSLSCWGNVHAHGAHKEKAM